MSSTIHIVIGVDGAYLQHAGVMLCSLFESNLKQSFTIHIITDDLKHIELKKLKRLIERYKQKYAFLQVNHSKVSQFKISEHATHAVYYRLMLPELLDPSIEKVLYLDCDLLVKRSIKELWETNSSEFVLAAVEEPFFNRHKQLDLNDTTPYFNSGVMLINLPLWRSEFITEKAIAFLTDHPDKILFWDQDALNVVLNGQWLALSPKWNQQVHYLIEHANKLNISKSDLVECQTNPAIIHFSSRFKPWQVDCIHPLKQEYFTYLSLTPWRSYKIPEQTIWHKVKQQTKRALNRMVGRNFFDVYA